MINNDNDNDNDNKGAVILYFVRFNSLLDILSIPVLIFHAGVTNVL